MAATISVIDGVKKNLSAMLDVLSRTDSASKEALASGAFAGEFDRLLELAREARPEIDARLWPTPLGTGSPAASYFEVEVYANQAMWLVHHA